MTTNLKINLFWILYGLITVLKNIQPKLDSCYHLFNILLKKNNIK